MNLEHLVVFLSLTILEYDFVDKTKTNRNTAPKQFSFVLLVTCCSVTRPSPAMSAYLQDGPQSASKPATSLSVSFFSADACAIIQHQNKNRTKKTFFFSKTSSRTGHHFRQCYKNKIDSLWVQNESCVTLWHFFFRTWL